jgi:hypothetical protein
MLASCLPTGGFFLPLRLAKRQIQSADEKEVGAWTLIVIE